MNAATKVIRQIAAGRITGQILREKADQLVASSIAKTGNPGTACKAGNDGKADTAKAPPAF